MVRTLRAVVLATVFSGLFALPALVDAQNTTSAEVAASIGKNVTVTTADGSTQRGKLLSLSATEAVLQKGDNALKLPLSNIRWIRRGDSHALRNGTLIGLAGGLVFGLVTCYGTEETCVDEGTPYRGETTLLFTGIGTGIGAAVGAIMHLRSGSPRIIFRGPAKTTLAIQPALSRRRLGFAGTVTW